MATGSRSPRLGAEERGTFLCPDFKACCCIYRAQQPWQPSLAGALAAAVLLLFPGSAGLSLPFWPHGFGRDAQEPGYVQWVCGSAFPCPAAPKPLPGGLYRDFFLPVLCTVHRADLKGDFRAPQTCILVSASSWMGISFTKEGKLQEWHLSLGPDVKME